MKKILYASLGGVKSLLSLTVFILCTVSLSAQKISGKVTDANGSPIAGAAVVVKNTSNGVTTDANGTFSLDNVAKGSILTVSFVGFKTKDINAEVGNMTIALSEADALGEVIVTGVFDKRSALNSSIAISSLSAKQIDRIVPASAADLLKNVPGIYVNSSLGEIRNTVYSRGVTTGKNDGGNYDYVSMQEDGLPVINVPYSTFSPDMFLRADATLSKVEAVRGGSASITGANAPGGIFNYISKTGGDKFEGEVRARVGLEGNGKNPYYRGDFDLGGPLSKNLTYNVGGFYRHSNGAQYPGYASNYGGQVKGNLFYKYNTGSLKLLLKVLDDHNLTAEAIPTTNYTDMKPATGFDNTSSVLPPAISVTSPLLDRGNLTYNPSDLWHSKYKSVGLNWEQNLGESGWKLSNNLRYSTKSNEAFTPLSIVTPLAMDNIVTYFILGSLNPGIGQIIPGTYNISAGGKQIMTVQSFSGFDYHITSPATGVSTNSLFFTPLIYQNYKVNEFMDQLSLTKRIKNMTFNIGGFLSSSAYDGIQGSQGVSLGTIQNHPQIVDIKATYGNPNPTDPNNGKVYQITNPNGVVNVGADQGYAVQTSKQTQAALFFGHTWEINNQLTFDWGLRYESVKINGQNNARALAPSTTGQGGADGNPLTTYDNFKAVTGAAFKYDKSLSYLSFSAALNYKISDNTAVYARFSNGKKSPGLDFYFNVSNTFAEKNLDPQIQNIQQFELGFKTKTENLTLSATPFYSELAHIPSSVTFTDANSKLYNPPSFFNTIRTIGVEIDGLYKISDNFGIRGAITLQNSKATSYKSWIHLPTGSATSPDSTVDNSGNKAAFVPDMMLNITPEFSTDRFYAGLTWSYMGSRQANFANAFTLPAFSQLNLSLAYDISSKFKLGFNINNLANNYGVLGWVGPGSFPDNLNLDGLTKEAIAKAPTAFHQSIAIPARAYFLTATYKF